VQPVAIFLPAVPDIRPVVHIRDHHILDSKINLILRLLHYLPGTDDDQNHARSSRNRPLAVDLLHVLDVDFIRRGFLKTIAEFFEKESKVSSSSNGNGGTTMRTPI